MDETTNQEVVEQPKGATPQEFIEKYKRLVDETGYQLVITPVWLARDDSTFSMQLQTSVGRAPAKQA